MHRHHTPRRRRRANRRSSRARALADCQRTVDHPDPRIASRRAAYFNFLSEEIDATEQRLRRLVDAEARSRRRRFRVVYGGRERRPSSTNIAPSPPSKRRRPSIPRPFLQQAVLKAEETSRQLEAPKPRMKELLDEGRGK
jgi:hypothetical protein